MVLVIDTSSARHALARVDGGRVLWESVDEAGRGDDLGRRVAAGGPLTGLAGVAVATGPGSFTGLRVGAAFGVGLAMGRGVPVLELATLELQAARARVPALALAEAGRGRVYFLGQDGPRLGEPAELPTDRPAVGWLRPETAARLRAAGVHLLPESGLRPFGEAAAGLVGGAREVPYGRVTLQYLRSFGMLA